MNSHQLHWYLAAIGPCGNSTPGAPSVDLIVGSKIIVQFQVFYRFLIKFLFLSLLCSDFSVLFCFHQKNYDMFYSVNPGTLEVNLLQANQPALNLWMSWDSDTTWTFIYEADFDIPPQRYVDLILTVDGLLFPEFNFIV
jgi:hypothetical protein